jgi:hypothetical protein
MRPQAGIRISLEDGTQTYVVWYPLASNSASSAIEAAALAAAALIESFVKAPMLDERLRAYGDFAHEIEALGR